MSENPFPVISVLREDESGLGFCLRAVAANGGQFASLRRLLGIGSSERFKADHAVQLAQWFCVDKSRLEMRLPAYIHSKGGARRFCYGHYFRQPGALRANQPQLCTECIFEKGYLKDVWDLTLSTCCLEHRLLLTGKCLQCQSVIKWNRKGIQWGSCRHQLVISRGIGFANSDLLNAESILQASFRSRDCLAMVQKASLPVWLSGLSVDGWMQVFYAFGLLKSEWVPLSPRDLSRCLAPTEAQDVVSRGFKRLQEFGSAPISHAKNWSAVVACVPLVNLMVCPTGLQDHSIGRQLFLKIFGHSELEDVVRRYPHMRQLDLFSEPIP